MIQRTFVIAEAGSTHDGSLPRMLDLIEIARDAGADAIKFQWTSDPKRLAQRRGLDADYGLLGWPADWFGGLRTAARAVGLQFMCTAYLHEDIATVAAYVDRFKIASIEAASDSLIRAHLLWGRPVLISTGAAPPQRLRELLDYRTLHPTIALLHCIAGYPAPIAEVNLRVLRAYSLDGFSDHTASPLTGALAVVAGARILEVHIRHDATAPSNPDYGHSLTRGDFATYVTNVRAAELALGHNLRTIQPSETVVAAIRDHVAGTQTEV